MHSRGKMASTSSENAMNWRKALSLTEGTSMKAFLTIEGGKTERKKGRQLKKKSNQQSPGKDRHGRVKSVSLTTTFCLSTNFASQIWARCKGFWGQGKRGKVQ